jgi:hypothetical protein
MKKQSPWLLTAALLVGLAVAIPAYAGPPPWAPAHGYRAKQAPAYHYVYYPAQQVYYAPASGTWFWMSGGNWRFGVHLPSHYHAYTHSGVSLTLHSGRPYVQHAYVEEHYGKPWREKHHRKHKEKHKHGRGHHHDGWMRTM